MQCPFCASLNSKVIDTRSAEGGIRRRRECEDCGRRFTTYERVAPLRLMVIKQDGRRESFDRDKILRGIQIACAKRPIETEAIEELVSGIESELYHRGSREVTSREIGEMVMHNLRKLDEVAYIRFATIYRRFADVEDLADEIESLMERRQREAMLKAQMRLDI
ncbi:MAG: transcriptional repressor NrdR [Anaerolineaceae bacterium]|jgi:transcriptional repressor NrdR|nr:transcriptional regulator NrdR [Anaerolineae bacterium]MDX9832497.1 transcriptional regulator NrdR [Anaerolineae bacterium]MDX9833245.1 transcriptional regulator NrdR [Anaerolineae bacterium]NLF12945.1 transcriptional repressor NrdR [Anaerolineaceae bacterium]